MLKCGEVDKPNFGLNFHGVSCTIFMIIDTLIDCFSLICTKLVQAM